MRWFTHVIGGLNALFRRQQMNATSTKGFAPTLRHPEEKVRGESPRERHPCCPCRGRHPRSGEGLHTRRGPGNTSYALGHRAAGVDAVAALSAE